MQRLLSGQLLRDHFPQGRMAFVVGPRQVGKTTVSLQAAERRGSGDLYRNWDDLTWRREVSRDPYGFLDAYRASKGRTKPLAVLDEIHKWPRWKAYLKGLWDTRKSRCDVLVTGSGRLDVYQRGGDSLLGRYRQYRLHPLSVREVLNRNPPARDYDPESTVTAWHRAVAPARGARPAFDSLLRWGGFPQPFLSANSRHHRLWIKERRDLLIREDLRDLTRIQMLSHVEQLVELLVPRAAALLSLNSLREDLQVALESVRSWMFHLERLYFVYLVRPYAGKIARSLKREPKLYLWDWSEISDEAARFENAVAGHLLKWCHFAQDWGHADLDLHFVRDKEKREADFLVTRDKKPWVLVEAKLSDTAPAPALRYFSERLGVKHVFQVVQNLKSPGLAGDVKIFDAPTFLALLPV